MYQFKRIKDIFSVDKTLTRSLYDNFGYEHPTWVDPHYYWWVIFHKKNWIGYSGLRVHDANSLFLGPMFIKPEYRGQGLQLKLIKKRQRLAKKMGCHRLISSALDTNYPSINNLLKCGFLLIPSWLETPEINMLYFEKKI